MHNDCESTHHNYCTTASVSNRRATLRVSLKSLDTPGVYNDVYIADIIIIIIIILLGSTDSISTASEYVVTERLTDARLDLPEKRGIQ